MQKRKLGFIPRSSVGFLIIVAVFFVSLIGFSWHTHGTVGLMPFVSIGGLFLTTIVITA
ncbi:MAG: hypothetical protein PHP62_03735 [Candidatus Moranbacteria bacterium]|nr:hypothetical protein [Candidatus Moranbacteria bacterium]